MDIDDNAVAFLNDSAVGSVVRIGGIGTEGNDRGEGQPLAAEFCIALIEITGAFNLGNTVVNECGDFFDADVVDLGSAAHEPLFSLILAGAYIVHAVRTQNGTNALGGEDGQQEDVLFTDWRGKSSA